MKKISTRKIIILIVIAIVTIINFNTTSYAGSVDDIFTQGEDFLNKGDSPDSVIDEDALKITSNEIYNILFTIGVVLSVAIGMVIGIQFIMGSVDEKAKIKETLVPYVVGVFIIFGAFTIWKIVVSIGNDVTEAKLPTKKVLAMQQTNTIENNMT